MIRYQTLHTSLLHETIGMMLSECTMTHARIFEVLLSISKRNTDKEVVDIALTSQEARELREAFAFVAEGDDPRKRAASVSLYYEAWGLANQSYSVPDHF
jgi:hypothetical protein